MTDKISNHITLYEATRSETANQKRIDNTPDSNTIETMMLTARMVFEPLRAWANIPIYITSFFRCSELDKAVGGSGKGQHTLGEAIDIDGNVLGGITNSQIFHFLKTGVKFDQLIWEFGDDTEPDWVHVSHRLNANRGDVLRGYRDAKTKKVTYIKT